jgi:phospholipid-binding lipoprotein MlaA
MVPMVAALAACATHAPGLQAGVEEINDPLEPINREIYRFNTQVRRALEPVRQATATGGVLAPIWLGIHNVLSNLREPLVFANDLAQGRECAAGASLRRFMVNSTLGVGGIFDVAKSYGVDAHDNNVGRTLATLGMPEGPYLVLPVLGPSDLRGTAGMAAEYVADPINIGLRSGGASVAHWPITGLDVTDKNFEAAPDLEKLERTSLDGYAALRSAYRQYEAKELKGDGCPEALQIGASASGRAGDAE